MYWMLKTVCTLISKVWFSYLNWVWTHFANNAAALLGNLKNEIFRLLVLNAKGIGQCGWHHHWRIRRGSSRTSYLAQCVYTSGFFVLWGHPVSNCLVSCSSHIFILFLRHFHFDRSSPHILMTCTQTNLIFRKLSCRLFKVKGNVDI